MKFLFSPIGLVIIIVLAVIIFMPRRMPDKVKKFGKPMRAFPEEPDDAATRDAGASASTDESSRPTDSDRSGSSSES